VRTTASGKEEKRRVWPAGLHVCDLVDGFRVFDKQRGAGLTRDGAVLAAFGHPIPERTFRDNRAYIKKNERLALRLYAHGKAEKGLWTRFRKLVDSKVIELSSDSDSSIDVPKSGQLTATRSLASLASQVPSEFTTAAEDFERALSSPVASSPARASSPLVSSPVDAGAHAPHAVPPVISGTFTALRALRRLQIEC
jgi:hypothetical protein